MEKEPLVYKQVIVVRKDLNMRKGKCVAQGAHASLAAILRLMEWTENSDEEVGTISLRKDSPVLLWLKGSFSKICVYVESEQELEQIYQAAEQAGIPCSLIIDSGRTEFHGESTKTAVGIGPWYAEEIDKITGHLKLL